MAAIATLPIALSCGDPAGIGPEISVKAWRGLGTNVPFFWIGDPQHLPDGAQIAEIDDPSEAPAAARQGIPVLRHEFAEPAVSGTPSPANATAVVDVIRRGVDLVMEGKAGALCTAPISKKIVLDHAGFAFPGHTEYLADLAGVDRCAMMLVADDFRVVPATIHIPL